MHILNKGTFADLILSSQIAVCDYGSTYNCNTTAGLHSFSSQIRTQHCNNIRNVMILSNPLIEYLKLGGSFASII